MTTKAEQTLERIRIAVEAAREKKAEGIEVLDLRGLTSVTDCFLICHGNSQRQVQAIAEEIRRRLRESRVRPQHVEGDQGSEWVLMDYIEFVVHIFTRDRRTFYGLERLWADAPHLDVTSSSGSHARGRPLS